MTIFIAVDSSLSMRSPIAEGETTTRWEYACSVAVDVVSRLLSLLFNEEVKLVQFCHNSAVLLEDVKSADEIGEVLSSVEVSASADLLSLFSLMKMKKAYASSVLLVLTDASAFTPEEIELWHLPECKLNFACVLDRYSANQDQLARFAVLTARSMNKIASECDDETFETFVPLFRSDYADVEGFAAAIVSLLYPPRNFILTCGYLSADIKFVPVERVCEWDDNIEVVGFLKTNNLRNVPTTDHHFITSRKDEKAEENSASDCFLVTLCKALSMEDSVALCHLNERRYGVICSIKKQENDFRLCIQSFPHCLSSVPWLPDLDRLSVQSVVDSNSEGFDLCVKYDGLSKPSYSSCQRTCWNDQHGFQSDLQKLVRLLKKIPDRLPMFYAELNRIHKYACVIGAEGIHDLIIKVIDEESLNQSSLIRKHAAYVCEKLRKAGLKDHSEVLPPQ